jgi:hypothetical protein
MTVPRTLRTASQGPSIGVSVKGVIVEAVAFFDSIEFNELWARVEPA